MCPLPGLKVTDKTPLLLRRAQEIPAVEVESIPGHAASHFTVCTTAGNDPEMHDQQEDQTRPR